MNVGVAGTLLTISILSYFLLWVLVPLLFYRMWLLLWPYFKSKSRDWVSAVGCTVLFGGMLGGIFAGFFYISAPVLWWMSRSEKDTQRADIKRKTAIAIALCGLDLFMWPVFGACASLCHVDNVLPAPEKGAVSNPVDSNDASSSGSKSSNNSLSLNQCLALAEQGDINAQFLNLGDCYERGRGVPRYKAEAIKCYQEAARQNHQDAIRCLNRLQGG